MNMDVSSNPQVDVVEALTQSLANCYEEIALLHRVSEGMRVSNVPETVFHELCNDLTGVLEAESALILLNNQDDLHQPFKQFISELSYLPESVIQYIWDRTQECEKQRLGVIVDSDIDSPFQWDWPEGIRSIVIVPIKRENILLGSLVALNKLAKPDFDSVDARLLISIATKSSVYLENHQLYHDLQDLMMGVLGALTSSIDAKDPYTCGHSERVAAISLWMGRQVGLSTKQLRDAYLGGLLHDVGKIGVSEQVLCKPGKLTDDEFEQIQRHPEIGSNILQGIKQLFEVNQAVLTHHERMDGTGYPNGLQGEEIPLIGRIVGLADSFDAMTSARVYRKALSLDRALEEIRTYSGSHYDPALTTILLSQNKNTLLDHFDVQKQNDEFDYLYRPAGRN
jgi:HD-GYP domain-containing protein (c-di-GMP phosphodiesterase class II)